MGQNQVFLNWSILKVYKVVPIAATWWYWHINFYQKFHLAGSILLPFARCYQVVSWARVYPSPLCGSMGSSFVKFNSAALLIVFGQNILQMMRRHLFTKVWNLCVMELETNHISHPYNNIEFIHELNIRSFVCLEISELAHTACILPKAVRALFSQQSAPPSVVILQPR